MFCILSTPGCPFASLPSLLKKKPVSDVVTRLRAIEVPWALYPKHYPTDVGKHFFINTQCGFS